MWTWRFIYYILVPNDAQKVARANSYDEELEDTKRFDLSKDEFDILYRVNGYFDIIDNNCGTIIAAGEEERIEPEDMDKALKLTDDFLSKSTDEAEKAAVLKVREALQYAKDKGVFCEIIGGVENYDDGEEN